jgi:hypothetical protein
VAANLIQQQREAENLTDEELLYFIQNGSPHINQIILLGVADDRARQRQAPQANQPPMPTIKDQKMQQLAGPSPFSGIGSIEQPQQYADGGIVGYADGGLVGYQHGGYHDPDDPQVPSESPYQRMLRHRKERQDRSIRMARDLGSSSGILLKDLLVESPGEYPLQGAPLFSATGDQMDLQTLPAEVLQRQRPMRSPAAQEREWLIKRPIEATDLPIRRPLPPLDSADPYGFGDPYMAALMETSMEPFKGITAPKMEEMDVRAQYAPLAELTEQLGIQTEGEAMRDRLAEQRVGQMSARRKRSQELQDAEMRGLPFGYAARIALGQEGPSLQEGIMSLIGRREAEREVIDQGVFEIQDLQAQRQAALERGALTSAIALESRIADATVKNIFDVAKSNADAELRTGIANLEQEIRLKIAHEDLNARRFSDAMRSLASIGSGESQEDPAEIMRAAAQSLEAIIAASGVLTEEQKEQAAEMTAALIQIAVTQLATGSVTLSSEE